jgi:16S rRNA (adenine1518-N6/adenine1519-N6)-dimethyltransferase
MKARKKTLSIFEILKKYNIRPIKHFGQNFLIDEGILNKIIEAADIQKNDTILEIGPGLGILTLELAKRAKQVIAIEKDKRMCEILSEMLDAGNVKNVEIVNENILKITNNQFPMTNYKIVANIPYYLTSPLIRKFLETESRPEFMVLMIQKEVAQRICASPPKMSLLAVSVQFYADPEIISYVSKNSFYPVPKVDSAIIKIIPKTIPDIDTEKFFKLVKTGFASKRKMLKNNLPKIDLEKLDLNPKVRAENLSTDDWIKIFHNNKLS